MPKLLQETLRGMPENVNRLKKTWESSVSPTTRVTCSMRVKKRGNTKRKFTSSSLKRTEKTILGGAIIGSFRDLEKARTTEP